MGLRSLGVLLVASALLPGSMAASASRAVPRFSLSSTTASPNDDVTLRVEQTPRLPQRAIRLYLVPRGVAPTLHSRLDSRLSFIGSVRTSRHARLVFTVPPLDPGGYALAYWCRDCLPRGEGIGVAASPTLRVSALTGEGCPATLPNGRAPRGEGDISPLKYHGNGALWASLRPDGVLVTNPLGGYKMRWWAKEGVSGRLMVQYRMLNPRSASLTARTGTLSGGDSTMSQMSFSPGCWQINGRVLDVSLSFVVEVVRGNADARHDQRFAQHPKVEWSRRDSNP